MVSQLASLGSDIEPEGEWLWYKYKVTDLVYKELAIDLEVLS